MVAQDSLARSGIEIYKTKDSNIEKVSDEEDREGFVLHNGTITEISYFDEMFNNSFEYDYEDISNGGSVSLPEVDETKFYKGQKILLKKAWNANKWDDLEDCLLGFITEQSYTEDSVEIKISGMSKLLEQKKEFSFTKTKISVILKEMIETAGLKAEIDTKGLNDVAIDYSNVSGGGGSDLNQSTGSASIDEAVKNAIRGKTDDLEKAKAIDKAFKSHVIYKYYFDVHHPDLDEAWSNAHLNCADGANVLCAMFIAGGLIAVIVHTSGHYIVKLTIKGKTYYTDNAANSGNHTTRQFGEVWRGITSGSEVGTKISA